MSDGPEPVLPLLQQAGRILPCIAFPDAPGPRETQGAALSASQAARPTAAMTWISTTPIRRSARLSCRTMSAPQIATANTADGRRCRGQREETTDLETGNIENVCQTTG